MGSKNSSLREGPWAPQLIRFSLPTVSNHPLTLSISHYGLSSLGVGFPLLSPGVGETTAALLTPGAADATEGHISHLKLEAWHNTHVAYYTPASDVL
ncbi:hypothetical protein AVEN_88888-1 [Araneus ventricosus]|uniref:Uncharacterized protein n=1 Tax=Araneus ventricosus TaxID=182803 RepID=A0A4Y2MFW3_ARAVE|nr:hypothetical protein AVEN_88888-1 [Araneus ventricosus]